MIFSICSQFYFWLSLLCSGIPRLTLVDSIMWIHSLEDQLGSWEALAGGGAVGRESPWVLLPYPSATFLAAFCGWCPAGFHSFTNIVSAPSCPSSPEGANSSLLLPVFGAPGFSSVPLSFQQSFYKIFLFLFWTICGELGFPDGYHSTGKADAFLPIVPKLLLQHQDLSLGLFQWHSLFQLLFRPSLLFFLHFLFFHLLPPAACAPAPWWRATGKLGVLQEHRHDSAQGVQMVGGWLCHWSPDFGWVHVLFAFSSASLVPPTPTPKGVGNWTEWVEDRAMGKWEKLALELEAEVVLLDFQKVRKDVLRLNKENSRGLGWRSWVWWNGLMRSYWCVWE